MIDRRLAATRLQQLPDAALAAGLFACAMVVGVFYCAAFERSGSAPEPWAKELGAAVALACGHGFVDPGYEPSPGVAAFLNKRIDRISCEELPTRESMGPPNFTQRLYRYMTVAVGLTWKLFGVSWTRLSALLGLLYAITAVVVYGLFRLATTQAPSFVAAVIMILSPLQLRYLPQLRDYAKAPFLLTLVLILGLLVTRPFTRRRLFVLAVSYGAVAGIGFGFRNDLLISALPFVLTVCAFLPVPFRADVGPKLAAVALAALSFVVCAWPIISAYRSGSNSGHVALLGLMTHFNRPLGVTASVYDWGAPYDDGFAIKVINSYTARVHHRPVSTLSSEYDRAMVEYLLLIGRHWPADMLIRGYASVIRVLELPFQIRLYTTAAPPGIADGMIGRLYAIWVALLSHLHGAGLVVSVFAIVTVAGTSVRIATWLLLSLLYFGAYPAVQFDARHFFFLEFIPWLALATVGAGALGLFASGGLAGSADTIAAYVRLRGRRVLAFALASLVVVFGPLVVLRAYQQRHVAALLQDYLELPTETLTLNPASLSDGRVLLRPNELSQSTESSVRAEYLVADIGREECTVHELPVTFRYTTMSGYTDLSQQFDVPVPQSGVPSRLFFPIYYSNGGYFAGVEVSQADRKCVRALRRVTDVSRTPILLNLTLPPEWREMTLYQTLASKRNGSHG
jgi:hypothetical protein